MKTLIICYSLQFKQSQSSCRWCWSTGGESEAQTTKADQRGGYPHSKHIQWCTGGHCCWSGGEGISCWEPPYLSKPQVFFVSFLQKKATPSPSEPRWCQNWRVVAENIIRWIVPFVTGRRCLHLCHRWEPTTVSSSWGHLCRWYLRNLLTAVLPGVYN